MKELGSIVTMIIGVVIAYFIVGLTPALWMGLAFLIMVVGLLIAHPGINIVSHVGIIIALLVPIVALVFLFIKFGWQSALIFAIINVVVFLVFVVIMSWQQAGETAPEK